MWVTDLSSNGVAWHPPSSSDVQLRMLSSERNSVVDDDWYFNTRTQEQANKRR